MKPSEELFPDHTHEPSDAEVYAELERELELRRRVYPRWVERGHQGITGATAAHRLRCLEIALHRFGSDPG